MRNRLANETNSVHDNVHHERELKEQLHRVNYMLNQKEQ